MLTVWHSGSITKEAGWRCAVLCERLKLESRILTMRFARMALISVVSLGIGVAAEARAASGPTDIVLPAPHPRPAAEGASVRQPVPLLEGCGSTPVSCNTDVRGQLAGGDCLSANISFFDEFVFQVNIQELVTATFRPLNASFDNAWIGFIPPSSDPSLS